MTFIYWATELTVCEWQMILCRLSWVPSDCIHSHSGSVGLIASEWFHARSSWVPSDHFHSCSGPDLAWQWVSDFMPGPATYLLIILTITLVLLAWQPVSDFMLGSAGCLLTVFTSTLVLLAWQQVSNFMSGAFNLIVLTPTLVLLAQQIVSDFVPVQPLGTFWLFSLPLWSCWLDSKWVISYQAQLSAFWLGLTGTCEWFHTRPSWVPLDYPLFHSGPVGLTASE